MAFQDDAVRQRRLDAICNDFEERWRAGPLPDFDSYLAQIEPDVRHELMRQLLAVDVELRIKAGEQVLADAYESIHPDARNIVQACLSSQVAGEDLTRAEVDGDTAKIEIKSIGPYELIKKIGEGGMGSVWMAKQHHPIRRHVALKVIKAGGSSKEIITRFEAERQALALMDHPNIARILDAGTTPDERPFFAMELVQGTPLTRYCDQQTLAINQRLRLFCDVCSGVQHAHQKGIIHRDLKPSNILVAEVDGRPVPKVIDFGLAKALENTERLSEQTQSTAIGQILGTLKYMSPEQASLDAVDIDTRTDVYSLGVILYQLLTGSTPLDDESVQSRSVLSVLESIRDEEPVKPSSRLSNLGEKLSKITQDRSTDSLHLKRVLVGDLDWIVMKALDKDRSRRYGTATDLAQDVTRYLNDQAVEARPPSAGYRARKFVRKHRAAVAALTATTASLIAGIAFTTWFAFQANSSRINENIAKEKAIEERDAANKRLVQIEKGTEILGTIFQDLNLKHGLSDGNSLRLELAERLKHAADQVDAELIGDPATVARLQTILGESLCDNGNYAEAIPILQRASKSYLELDGFDSDSTRLANFQLCQTLIHAQRPQEALPILEKLVVSLEVEFGRDAPRTLNMRGVLANVTLQMGNAETAIGELEAVRDQQQRQLGPENEDTQVTMLSLAEAYRSIGQADRAIKILEKLAQVSSKAHGPKSFEALLDNATLGNALTSGGRFQDGIQLLKQTLTEMINLVGPAHDDSLRIMCNLAYSHLAAREADEAIRICNQVLTLAGNRNAMKNHKLFAMSYLGEAYVLKGDLDKGIQMLEQAIGNHTVTSVKRRADLLIAKVALADAFTKADRLDEAINMYTEIVESQRQLMGADHPEVFSTMTKLGTAYTQSGEVQRAVKILEQVKISSIRKLGEDHEVVLATLNQLGLAFGAANRIDDAVQCQRDLLEIQSNKLGADHVNTLIGTLNLAVTLLDIEQPGKAAELLEQMEEPLTTQFPSNHPIVQSFRAHLGKAYRQMGRHDDAAGEFKYLVESIDRNNPAIVRALFALVDELFSAGHHDQVIETMAEFQTGGKLAGPASEMSIRLLGRLGKSCLVLKRMDEAISAYQEQVEQVREHFGDTDQMLADSLALLAVCYLRDSQAEEAEPLVLEAIEIQDNIQPEIWPAFHLRGLLGEALLAQDQLTESQAQLAESFAGLSRLAPDQPPEARNSRPIEILGLLIKIAEMQNNQADREKWQAEKDALSNRPTP